MSALVWLPGGHGMLGHAAQRVLKGLGHAVLVTGREVPLHDDAAVRRLLERESVTHVVNCAGYTAVDKAESEPEEAALGNVTAPAVLGRVTGERGLPVLHVSTDYVFSGAQTSPIVEDEPPAPRSAYGRTKLEGERAFLESRTDAPRFIVRTSWLFGREKKHFVATMLRLMAEREELRVVDDQRGRPTFADDLASAAAGLLGLDPETRADAPSGTYHFASAGETTWHGFATQILERGKARGLTLRCQRVVPISTAEYPTPAARPAYSVLDTTKIERALGRPSPLYTLGLERVIDDARGEKVSS